MSSRLQIALACGVFAMMCILLIYHRSVPQLEGFTVSRHDIIDSGTALYAIADLHGDYQKAVKALQLAGLVGSDGYWSGNDATVIQLGDLMDRGSYSLDCVNLFQRLKAEARQSGGKVHTLLGNHELMNLEGMHQYVAREELQRLLKDMEPEALSFDEQRAQSLSLWKRRLQPDHDIGRALRQSSVAMLGGMGRCRTLFVHAGMLPGLLSHFELRRTEETSPEELLQDLDSMAIGALRCLGGTCKPPESALRLLNDPDGILWYRGYAQKSEGEFCSSVWAVLRRLEAAQMVVGHNVMPGGKARVACKKSLYMMDVGMSSAYLNAAPTVWKCHKGNVKILS